MGREGGRWMEEGREREERRRGIGREGEGGREREREKKEEKERQRVHAPHAMLCRVAKFNGVTSLLAYFPTNYGAETTKIYYIGLRGDFTKVCC